MIVSIPVMNLLPGKEGHSIIMINEHFNSQVYPWEKES